MNDISNIGVTNLYAPAFPSTAFPSVTQAEAVESVDLGPADPVEFSRAGRLLAGTLEPSSLRLARLKAIKSQIDEGVYETPERIAGTVEALMRELRPG